MWTVPVAGAFCGSDDARSTSTVLCANHYPATCLYQPPPPSPMLARPRRLRAAPTQVAAVVGSARIPWRSLRYSPGITAKEVGPNLPVPAPTHAHCIRPCIYFLPQHAHAAHYNTCPLPTMSPRIPPLPPWVSRSILVQNWPILGSKANTATAADGNAVDHAQGQGPGLNLRWRSQKLHPRYLRRPPGGGSRHPIKHSSQGREFPHDDLSQLEQFRV